VEGRTGCCDIFSDRYVDNFSLIFLFFYIFQYVKLPCKNYLN
jgi:hypothetical protein